MVTRRDGEDLGIPFLTKILIYTPSIWRDHADLTRSELFDQKICGGCEARGVKVDEDGGREVDAAASRWKLQDWLKLGLSQAPIRLDLDICFCTMHLPFIFLLSSFKLALE